MPILIDGDPEWMIGYDNSMPDPSYYELYSTPVYGGPNTPEIKAARKVSKIASWAVDEVRRANASALMSELRKSGHVKPTYSPERNAKIKAWHARRRLEKQGELK